MKAQLERFQPCGCVVCICDNDEQCQGCGSKSCKTHPVGEIPNPVFEKLARRPYDDPTAKRRNVYMSEEVAHKLKALGNGNLSAGIREAVRQTQEREDGH